MTQSEEFEEWYEREGQSAPYSTISIKGKMYDAWQAARAQAVPQWIPVSERLPEYGVPVIISVSGETKYSAYMLCCTDGSGDWFEEINGIGPDFTQVEDVDAWMPWPLPASPVVSSEMEYTTN